MKLTLSNISLGLKPGALSSTPSSLFPKYSTLLCLCLGISSCFKQTIQPIQPASEHVWKSIFIFSIPLGCRQVGPNPREWLSPSSAVVQGVWCSPFMSSKNKVWIPCHLKKKWRGTRFARKVEMQQEYKEMSMEGSALPTFREFCTMSF